MLYALPVSHRATYIHYHHVLQKVISQTLCSRIIFNPRIALLFLRTRVAHGVKKAPTSLCTRTTKNLLCSFPTAPWGFRQWRVQRKWLRQRPTTGNSNMATQTGNNYIYMWNYNRYCRNSNSNSGFSTTRSSRKVPSNDCVTDRQPEIIICPPKPEILIFLEVW